MGERQFEDPFSRDKYEPLPLSIDSKGAVIKDNNVYIDSKNQLIGLKNDIEKFPKNSEGMIKAFEIVKTTEGAQKYLLISKILDVFVYGNGLSIVGKDSTGIFSMSSIKLVGTNEDLARELLPIIQNNLNVEEYKKTIVFHQALREGNIKNRAENIAKRLDIKLIYNNDSEKNQLISQIDSDNRLSDNEKIILIAYISGNYQGTITMANNYANQTAENIAQNAEEIRRNTKINIFDKKQQVYYGRHPDALVGDIIGSVMSNQVSFISVVSLIIGKIMGYSVFDTKGKDGKVIKEGNWLMKLFAAGATLGAYDRFGLGDYIGDKIEKGRDFMDKGPGESKSAISIWTEKLVESFPSITTYAGEKYDEVMSKLSEWYYLAKFKFGNPKEEMMNCDFTSIYNTSTKNDFIKKLGDAKGNDLSNDNDKKVVDKLKLKLEEIKFKGIKKYGDEEGFFKEISGLTVAEVIAKIEGQEKKSRKDDVEPSSTQKKKEASDNYEILLSKTSERVKKNEKLNNLQNINNYIDFINSNAFQKIDLILLFPDNFDNNVFSNLDTISDGLKLPDGLNILIFKRVLRQYLVGDIKGLSLEEFNAKKINFISDNLKTFKDLVLKVVK